ncbi:Alpha-galactosidase A precursor [compost metagenome]
MLQVGRGMSYDEDKSHFTMWCAMNSPLLLGNDLRTISKETLNLVTNKELIAINQDQFGYQARRLKKMGDVEVWAKPLISAVSGQIAVVLLNRSNTTATIDLDIEQLGLSIKKGYVMRDLWAHKDYPLTNVKSKDFKIPAHGVVALKIVGKSTPFNLFQTDK